MFSVALIGPDGAGKTTLARKLEQSLPLPVKYLYMGINMESSNVALPTSRLAEAMKRRRSSKPPTPRAYPALARKRSGNVRAALRLANRLAEECYRHLLSWSYRRRGVAVIYDRHFRFDFEYDHSATARDRRFTDRLHRWWLANIYPRPDLVIYLDAPPEVLFARKREGTLESLESRRQAFLSQGKRTPNFVRVDATQALEAVYAQVSNCILEFSRSRTASAPRTSEVLP